MLHCTLPRLEPCVKYAKYGCISISCWSLYEDFFKILLHPILSLGTSRKHTYIYHGLKFVQTWICNFAGENFKYKNFNRWQPTDRQRTTSETKNSHDPFILGGLKSWILEKYFKLVHLYKCFVLISILENLVVMALTIL